MLMNAVKYSCIFLSLTLSTDFRQVELKPLANSPSSFGKIVLGQADYLCQDTHPSRVQRLFWSFQSPFPNLKINNVTSSMCRGEMLLMLLLALRLLLLPGLHVLSCRPRLPGFPPGIVTVALPQWQEKRESSSSLFHLSGGLLMPK